MPIIKLLDNKDVAFDFLMSDGHSAPRWPRPPTNVATASASVVLRAGRINVQTLIDAFPDKYTLWFKHELAMHCEVVGERCTLRLFDALSYMMAKDKYQSFWIQCVYQYGVHLDRWFGRCVQTGASVSECLKDAMWTQNADESVGEEAEMSDSFKTLGKSMSPCMC